MNKKILLMILTICLIVVFACAFVACSNGGEQQGAGHTHSFSSTYSYNSTSHWQNCSCGLTQNYGLHVFGAWIVDYDATQYRNGSKHRTCAICGYTERETIYYQHTHEFDSTYSYDANYHWQGCSCGAKQNYNTHSYGDWVIDTHATDLATGSKHRTCLVCGYVEYGTIDRLPHNHSFSVDYQHDDTHHWQECPCGEKQNYNAHSFGAWVVDSDAQKHKTCTICGYDEFASMTYTVVWKNWHGTVLETDANVEYGARPTYNEATPTREGDEQHYWSFDGWSPSVVSVTSDAIYTAELSLHEKTSYVITYNSNGGSADVVQQTKQKGQVTTLSTTTPTYEGHVFVGWNNIYEDKVYQPGDAFTMDRDVTLWAMWGEYCVSCNHTGKVEWICQFCYKGYICPNCGGKSVTITNGLGSYCTTCLSNHMVSTLTKVCGWCNGNYKENVDCSHCNGLGYEKEAGPIASIIEARKIVLENKQGYEYSIGGTVWRESNIFENLKPSTTYKFYQRRATSENVPFGCTSKELTVKTDSTDIFFVKYDLGGGVNDAHNPSLYNVNTPAVRLYDPTRDHYNFTGWEYGDSVVTEINPSWNVDVTIIATWTLIDYSIEYYLNGGTATNPTSHNVETEEIVLNAPTREGFVFVGWTGSNGDTPELKVVIPAGNTENLAYTAHWTGVVLKNNIVEAGEISGYKGLQIGEEESVTATTYLGYIWIGWYAGEDLLTGDSSYTFVRPAEAVTYTAKWEMDDAMENFTFTSTLTTCEITGLKDQTVTEIVIPNYVTSIGNNAFENCTGLTSITIPDSVTSIGDYAFRRCICLTSITIPNSVTSLGDYAFCACSLTSVTIPDSVTSMGDSAFLGCTSLTSINIGDGVTSIGGGTFYLCYGLSSVTIGDNVTNIGSGAFQKCYLLTSITIPNSVTSIGDSAFYDCKRLIEVYNKSALPITVGGLDYGCAGLYAKNVYTEEGGSKLYTDENGYVIYIDDVDKILVRYDGDDTELVLPNDLTKIHQNAFYNCISLMSVTISNSVTSIGDYAFYNCTSLTSVTIPDSVTSIGNWAFENCTVLTTINYSGDIAGWCEISGLSHMMRYGTSSKSLYFGCELVENLLIPSGVTTIPHSAFYGCGRLTSITIPNSVTSIGLDAFFGCTGLTSIEGNTSNAATVAKQSNPISFSVIITSGTSIDNRAFSNCSGLKSITIPDGVTTIGGYAFYFCKGLKSVIIPNSVIIIEQDAFYNCAVLTSITFNGTIEQWNTISKGNKWNQYMPKYTVHCTDGDCSSL